MNEMVPIELRYPHARPAMEPLPMRASDVWRLAEEARRQVWRDHRQLRFEVGMLATRCRRLMVNAVAFDLHWECGEPIADERGQQVMGVTEHDERAPAAAMIYLNGPALADQDDLARSTAAHELGHAVFDAPAWVWRAHKWAGQPGEAPQGLHYQEPPPTPAKGSKTRRPPIDWREWRANEFMGAFLAPRGLLHHHLHRRAAALGVPMVAPRVGELPVISVWAAGFDGIDAVTHELAEMFGVSIAFMETRLAKYGLVIRR